MSVIDKDTGKKYEGKEIHEGIISSGNSEIDRKMGGGIPVSSLCLIEGVNDSGKSVLVQQMIKGGLDGQNRILMFTTENTVRSLLRQMESLALGITDYYIVGRAKIYPIQEKLAKENRETAETLLQVMLRTIETCKEDLIIIDSLTVFVVDLPENEILDFFTSCKKLCDHGKTVMITAHADAFSEMLLIRIRSICDVHLHLKLEQMGEQMIKSMEISKVKGAQKATGNIISFDVRPNFGFKIIPISKARA